MNIAEVKQNYKIGSMGNNPLNAKVQRGNTQPQSDFGLLMDNLRNRQASSSAIADNKNGALLNNPRLPGDFIGSFRIENPTPADSHTAAQGMARSYGNSGGTVYEKREIDKTSALYEQALELESYFIKVMLESMRKTLTEKTLAGDQSFAGKMYKDMMYDELGRTLTKHSGSGLADQIYLELTDK